MKIVIIGNGVAGTFTAQNIRNQDKEVKIELYSQERYPYYSRIKLPKLISEKVSIEDLIVYKEDWYKARNIKVFLNKKVNTIHPKLKHIIVKNEKNPVSYDNLILAMGSMPNIPPIKNAVEMIGKGVSTLRNIDNALKIRKYIKDKSVKKAVVIGGGLLGLELAKQIKDCDIDTIVVEFFPRLLPKQLDLDCGGLLKEEIEKMGIKVILNATTEEILGNDSVNGIKIKGGQELEGDIVLIQAGIKPTIDLAMKAKINTNKGIIVNQYMETSVKGIYAVGDCIEYKNQTWGIIPACIEQSKFVAASVLGKKNIEYTGTVPKNTLKIVGIDLTTIGIFSPEDKEAIGVGWEILRSIDKKDTCYKKIVLKGNKLKGAILFGEKEAAPYINKNIESEINIQELRKILEWFIWKCSNCGAEYDDAKMEQLFKDLAEDWKCKCGASKRKFKKKE